MKVDIYRIERNNLLSRGVFVIDGEAFCVCLENPWKNNEPFVSCIPSGTYTARRFQSPKYGDVFQIYGVDGRSLILIHWGNYERNTQGCILIARNYAAMNGERAIAASKAVFNEFMKRMEGVDEFEIEFHDVGVLEAA